MIKQRMEKAICRATLDDKNKNYRQTCFNCSFINHKDLLNIQVFGLLLLLLLLDYLKSSNSFNCFAPNHLRWFGSGFKSFFSLYLYYRRTGTHKYEMVEG